MLPRGGFLFVVVKDSENTGHDRNYLLDSFGSVCFLFQANYEKFVHTFLDRCSGVRNSRRVNVHLPRTKFGKHRCELL